MPHHPHLLQHSPVVHPLQVLPSLSLPHVPSSVGGGVGRVVGLFDVEETFELLEVLVKVVF